MRPIDIEDILVRALQGRTNAEEEGELDRWRARSPKNESRYQLLLCTWRRTAHYDPRPRDDALPVADVLRAAAQAERSRGRGRIRRTALASAAMMVLLGGGYLAFHWHGHLTSESQASYGEIIATGSDERATVTLSDGTAVRLGPRSTLRVFRDEADVTVWLEGRAFFGVHPGSNRVFSVRTPQGEAMALGTRFEVRSEGGELQVVVMQGGVRVSSAGEDVELDERQMSRNGAGDPPSVSHLESVDELMGRLDWMGPVLVFRRTPLERVLSEIAHRYGVQVAIDAGVSAEAPITGMLSDLPVEDALLVICEIVGASCVQGANGFRLVESTPHAPRPGVLQ